jgi:hypothetical protein
MRCLAEPPVGASGQQLSSDRRNRPDCSGAVLSSFHLTQATILIAQRELAQELTKAKPTSPRVTTPAKARIQRFPMTAKG